MTHLRSLREYITALESIGEIQRIDAEVDWNLEIGAIIRRSYDLRAPAPLFTNITGYAGSGFRVLGAPAALSGRAHPLARTALSLGLPATTTGRQIIEAVVAARDKPSIPPVEVDRAGAPRKQAVAHGADTDLYRFPIPLIDGSGGGRYIHTYGMTIVATPDGAWTNWSVNRMMIAGKDRGRRPRCVISATRPSSDTPKKRK